MISTPTWWLPQNHHLNHTSQSVIIMSCITVYNFLLCFKLLPAKISIMYRSIILIFYSCSTAYVSCWSDRTVLVVRCHDRNDHRGGSRSGHVTRLPRNSRTQLRFASNLVTPFLATTAVGWSSTQSFRRTPPARLHQSAKAIAALVRHTHGHKSHDTILTIILVRTTMKMYNTNLRCLQ